MYKFKVEFTYWGAIEVEVGAKFDLKNNLFWSNHTSWRTVESAQYWVGEKEWAELDQDMIKVTCALENFEVVSITKAYGDNGTAFFIEGECIECAVVDKE